MKNNYANSVGENPIEYSVQVDAASNTVIWNFLT